MSILVVREGYNRGATYRLGQRSLTVGRDPGNLIQVLDDKISRRHARITWSSSGYVVTDLRSHNGVFINGQRVEAPVLLKIGDVLKVGGTRFELVREMALTQDHSLAGKVVDKAVVATETEAVDASVDVQAQIDMGHTIDLDAAVQQQELKASVLLYEMQSLRQAGAQPRALFDKALEGIVNHIGPDRAFVFAVTGAGKAVPVATFFTETIDLERRRSRPYAQAIMAAFKNGRAFILNHLPAGADANTKTALGSAAVVPIVKADGRMVGLLYSDSFADSFQAYVEDDLELMKKIAAELAEMFRR